MHEARTKDRSRIKEKLENSRISYLGISCNDVSMDDALEYIDQTSSHQFVSVVTPNIDHILKLNSGSYSELNCAYANASLILNDSKVVKIISFFLRLNIKNVVTGSDLVSEMLQRTCNQRILLVGPDNNQVVKLKQTYPSCAFDNIDPNVSTMNENQLKEIIDLASQPYFDTVLFCMGCPISEYLLSQTTLQRTTGLGVSCGAAVDFLSGKQRRAPRIFRRVGLEWLFRALSNPTRLGKRYFWNITRLPILLLKLISSHTLHRNRCW